MKRLLIGTLIALSASLVNAASVTPADMGEECEQTADYVASQTDKIALFDGASSRIPAGDNPVAPMDCALTPYVGVCESIEDSSAT